ncbi:endolysin [Morganella phage Mecenats66]|nr:endolysin [Morganella phage Mecenats66]
MKRLLWFAACIFLIAQTAAAADIPANAKKFLPVLVQNQKTYWPDAPIPDYMAGLVEQESCISLKHSKCWSPYAQLKTSREWGRGLGQVTTAYRADGSVRFDTQEELRKKFPELRGWTTDRWDDPDMQLRAIVLQNKMLFDKITWNKSPRERVAFTLSSYNGGLGGVLQDRRYCSNISGCDPDRWFNNVEKNSLKSKKPWPGYGGKSAYEINREYVRLILDVRRQKYSGYFE